MKYMLYTAKVTLLLISITAAYAIDNPYEAIENMRQQEREQQLKLKQEQKPSVKIEKPKLESAEIPINETPCVLIKNVSVFDDSGKFGWATSELKDYLKDKLPMCIGKDGVSAIMKKLQNTVIAKGFVTTRVSAKPQDLNSGILQLSIIPGRAKNIKVIQNEPKNRVFVFNTVPIAEGDIVNIYDIEQGLENLKRPPTADADINFTPSTDKDSVAGDSDVNIKWAQPSPFRFNASIDDSGSKSTGKYQGSATLSVDNPFGFSDLFYISMNKDFGGGDRGARGTKGASVYYAIPYDYWLFSFDSTTANYYQTVVGTSNSYIYSGDSFSQTVSASRVMYRDDSKKIKFTLSGWKRTSNSYVDGSLMETQRRRTVGVDTALNYSHGMKYASLDTTLTYKRGLKKLNSLEAPESETDGGSSFPRIIKFDANLNIPFVMFGKQGYYGVNYRTQRNQTPLIPNDYFYIGGRYSVRGFDGINTLASERGYILSNEVSVSNIAYGIGAYVGIDHGSVEGRDTSELIGKSLTGGVVGIRGGYKHLTYDLFVGKPLKKPNGFDTSSITTGFSIGLSI